MLDAIMFLSGAVLFLLAVVFFTLAWADRVAIRKQRQAMEAQQHKLLTANVELEILQHELEVWQTSLAHEERQLEQAREELRMLTASGWPAAPLTESLVAPAATSGTDGDYRVSEGRDATASAARKNRKRDTPRRKL